MSTKLLKRTLHSARRIFLPIDNEELKLFLPMALMMLFMLFNFGALRSLKDALVVPSIGAEVISFLKLWLVLPSSVIFTIIYAKLSNIFSFEKVFYIVVSTFLVVFLFFSYILYPNQSAYHLDTNLMNELILLYPNFQWFIQIAGKWSYALMYIFAELWSVVVINLMFWQFANQICNTEQAKRFYPLLGMLANTGLVVAGNVLVIFSDVDEVLTDISSQEYREQCQTMLQPIILCIVFAGISAMILFRFINKVVLRTDMLSKKFNNITEDTKTRLSLKESIRLVLQSKYIGHIVILVLCYGLSINLLEGPWKAKVKEYYPTTIEYVNFMGQFNIYMGITCIILMFIASNILRRLNWLTSALFTPIVVFCTGTLFFIFMIFTDKISVFGLVINPIFAAVIIGAVQNILCKATKYSLFDSTKEMAYIPLSLELRTKGKATVEVIGLKCGKSLGAFVQSSVFMIVPSASFNSMSGYLMTVFLIFIVIWIHNVFSLNKEYTRLVE